ncbi:hypothetical protein, partial [Roseiconus nitratireducens]|uniref:hypothetical protein n=1 Tax=Roseiconus nitratireducens TaxID=2605748 RepID=UPI001F260317
MSRLDSQVRSADGRLNISFENTLLRTADLQRWACWPNRESECSVNHTVTSSVVSFLRANSR